jgi:LemA protein
VTGITTKEMTMGWGTGIVSLVIFSALVFAVVIYNKLVRQRNLMQEGWSGVDVQLKRRHDLVGNLVESVRAYMTHEKSTLEEVIRARAMSQNAADVGESSRAEGFLTQALGRLFAVAENYPEIKAGANMSQLQDDLGMLEDEIQKARRYYNGTVRDMNILVESFPSNIIAQMFSFTKGVFFELENEAERQVPIVRFS